MNQPIEPTAKEIMDAHEVAEMLGVKYGWVMKHSQPHRAWRIPSFKIGKFRKYRRSAVIQAIIELEKSARPST